MKTALFLVCLLVLFPEIFGVVTPAHIREENTRFRARHALFNSLGVIAATLTLPLWFFSNQTFLQAANPPQRGYLSVCFIGDLWIRIKGHGIIRSGSSMFSHIDYFVCKVEILEAARYFSRLMGAPVCSMHVRALVPG